MNMENIACIGLSGANDIWWQWCCWDTCVIIQSDDRYWLPVMGRQTLLPLSAWLLAAEVDRS